MHSKKFFVKKILESSGIIFAALLIFAAIALAAFTTWSPGAAPAADPGDGNVAVSNLWSQSGSNIFYSAGNVGIGMTAPTVNLEVEGNIIADTPTESDHVATKAYVDQQVAAAGAVPYIDWSDCEAKYYCTPYNREATVSCSSGYTLVDSNCAITEKNGYVTPCFLSDVDSLYLRSTGDYSSACGSIKCCKYID